MNTNTRPFSSARDEVNINILFAASLYFEKGLAFGPAYMTPTSRRSLYLIQVDTSLTQLHFHFP